MKKRKGWKIKKNKNEEVEKYSKIYKSQKKILKNKKIFKSENLDKKLKKSYKKWNVLENKIENEIMSEVKFKKKNSHFAMMFFFFIKTAQKYFCSQTSHTILGNSAPNYKKYKVDPFNMECKNCTL